MSEISKYQKFEAKTINRSEIKNADYNPRRIGEAEAKLLKKSLKTHGLVDTLIFNKQTGNLVGGHQRLAQLDSLENGTDYALTVSVTDVPLKKEKEINLMLNNPNAQGEYDFEMVKDLILDLDLDATGFTDYDLSIMGVEKDVEEITKEEKSREQIEADIAKVKEAKQKSKDKNVSQGENYIVVTFGSVEAKESFLETLGHEVDDRYVKGEILLQKIKF